MSKCKCVKLCEKCGKEEDDGTGAFWSVLAIITLLFILF